ncbi:MAG TPA: 50S ribosomal protein L15 [Candidatus Moranbacteria bacterium]|nr:50S ribosomal protein L15 [Candidatus Moranbacteria bacterium]
MQIHELKVKAKKSRKRVGRGGKRGTYSGRGMKGQKSRSGGNVNPLFEGGKTSLIQKLKKKRGFKAVQPKKNVFKLEDIEKNFEDGSEITIASFVKKGLLRKSKAKSGIKILGTGSLTKKVIIKKDVLVSKSAIEMIKKVGGKVEVAKRKVRRAKKMSKINK